MLANPWQCVWSSPYLGAFKVMNRVQRDQNTCLCSCQGDSFVLFTIITEWKKIQNMELSSEQELEGKSSNRDSSGGFQGFHVGGILLPFFDYGTGCEIKAPKLNTAEKTWCGLWPSNVGDRRLKFWLVFQEPEEIWTVYGMTDCTKLIAHLWYNQPVGFYLPLSLAEYWM